MIDINTSLIIQIVNFLLIMIVLNFILYRPIRRILQERRETFSGFEVDISDLATRTDQKARDFEALLLAARKDGFLRKDEIKGEGQEEEKKILSAATGEAEAKIEGIKEQIKGEISAARDKLRVDLDVFSRELAQKILGRSLS